MGRKRARDRRGGGTVSLPKIRWSVSIVALETSIRFVTTVESIPSAIHQNIPVPLTISTVKDKIAVTFTISVAFSFSLAIAFPVSNVHHALSVPLTVTVTLIPPPFSRTTSASE